MRAELITFIASMIPLIESRISIILGAEMGLHIWKSFAISVIGNMLVTSLLIYKLDDIIRIVKKIHPKLKQLIEWILNRYHHKHSSKQEAAGALGLILFVAVPLPGSGAYAGSALAYIFKFPKLLSLISISIGLTIAGVIVTLGYLGVTEIL
jgi:uncharacterized membrane protein